MSEITEWPVTFFDDEYLRIYRPQLTAERTREETDFVFRALGVTAGEAVLDLACGHGRHAIDMARRGLRVTGVDLSPRYLELAEADANAAGVEVRWLARDMRALDFAGEFDGAYSFFTSFGYYGDAENDGVIASLARALKPGGRLLLDLVNRDRMLAQPPGRTWNQREDGGLLMEEFTLDPRTSRLRVRVTLIEAAAGARPIKEYDVRLYTCAELTALLARHGLAVRDVWGGADGSVYAAESRRLVVLAVKSAAD